jgi:hypothetical protein
VGPLTLIDAFMNSPFGPITGQFVANCFSSSRWGQLSSPVWSVRLEWTNYRESVGTERARNGASLALTEPQTMGGSRAVRKRVQTPAKREQWPIRFQTGQTVRQASHPRTPGPPRLRRLGTEVDSRPERARVGAALQVLERAPHSRSLSVAPIARKPGRDLAGPCFGRLAIQVRHGGILGSVRKGSGFWGEFRGEWRGAGFSGSQTFPALPALSQFFQGVSSRAPSRGPHNWSVVL